MYVFKMYFYCNVYLSSHTVEKQSKAMAGKTRARVSFVFPHEFTEKRAATVRRRLGSEQTASCGYVQGFQNF